jgi:hexosaminidase
MKPILAVVLLTGAFTAAISSFAAPSIIPLPVTMQTRPGVFTLGPNVANPNGNARATRKIFVDAPSAQTGQYLAMMLSRSTGFQFSIVTNNAAGPVHNVIMVTTVNALSTNTLGTEGYELTVAPDSVVIRAPTQDGAFWGVQSLLQLFPPQIMSPQPVSGVAWTAPCVYIQDYPRYKYRGVMLDVARHFVDKQEVEKVMDGLALHKINQFHWHLNDDHGWRIEIKAYPQLTAATSTNTGAWRTSIQYANNPKASTAWNSFGKYGGYYSQEDIKEVVAYATARHINVIPEIEIPAHCTAALVSYPEFGCGNPDDLTHYNMDQVHYSYTLFSIANSWPFFTNVLNEVCDLFPSPYIHCGGDEVIATGDAQWTTYTPDANLMTSLGISTGGGQASRRAYQRYLTTNLVAYLQSKGRTFGGWSEIEDAGTITNALLYEWTTDKATNALLAGQPVVMCPNGINYYEVPSTSTNPYATNVEPLFAVGGQPSYKTLNNIYTYNPGATVAAAGSATNNIIGVQVNLWTENVPSGMNVEYKLFPRMCALGELGWTPGALKNNFTEFTNRVWQAGVQRFAQMGLNYNRENVPQIGTWGPTVSTSGQTATYDITSNVTKAGEIDIAFVYGTGANAIDVSNAILFENGVQIDTDSHSGRAGAMFPTSVFYFAQASTYTFAYYIFNLQTYHPGATYTVQATLTGSGGTASNGKVYMPNWN